MSFRPEDPALLELRQRFYQKTRVRMRPKRQLAARCSTRTTTSALLSAGCTLWPSRSLRYAEWEPVSCAKSTPARPRRQSPRKCGGCSRTSARWMPQCTSYRFIRDCLPAPNHTAPYQDGADVPETGTHSQSCALVPHAVAAAYISAPPRIARWGPCPPRTAALLVCLARLVYLQCIINNA